MRALGTLRPEERMALSLFYLEDMPIAKIASVMERTEGSVKTLLFRGKQHVSEYFKDLVFKTIIPRSVRLSEAPSHGMPINVYDKNNAGAKAYAALAKEVVERAW